MPPTPDPSQWWVFWPFSGLIVQDEHDSLSRPLFGDVTLISAEAFVHLFSEASKRYSTQDASNREDLTLLTKADSYLAVRRGGVVNTQWFMEDRKNEDFVKQVRRRALQVSALFTNVLLATSAEGHISGLSDQFHNAREQMALLEIEKEHRGLLMDSFGYVTDTFMRCDPDILSLSREKLEALLDQPQSRGLVQIMTAQRPPIAKSLYGHITEACVRLAGAILATAYTTQLLGAITCLELLLTNENRSTPYSIIKRRLAILVGQELLEKYEFENILQARHAYVHRGEEIEARKYPLQAIGISMHALLLCANVANRFKRKDSFLTYLDILDLNKGLEELESDLGISDDVLGQLRREQELAFLQFVDDTIEFDREYAMGLYDRLDRVYTDYDENL